MTKQEKWIVAAFVVVGWLMGFGAGRKTAPRDFACPPGKEPEILWRENGSAVVTGKCGNPLIRYYPPAKP